MSHPLELKDDVKREQAKQAMKLLWDAMELKRGMPIFSLSGDHERFEVYYRTYQYIGELLLGKDCPEEEMWT